MLLILYLVILVTTCANSDSNIWRNDYTYNEGAGGWFKLHRVPGRWMQARRMCGLEGAVLASPIDNNMYSAMKIIIKENGIGCGLFTGVHSIFGKGTFSSIEGVSLYRMPLEWASGEPDDADNNENCLVIVENGTVADVNCSEPFPFICYKKKTNDMFITQCGTTDKEYKFEPNTGNCYKFHRFGQNWWRAYATCFSEGGHLAVANSKMEATVLKGLLDQNPPNLVNGAQSGAFLGFLDWDKSGDWATIHGSSLEDAGYAGWSAGQPDNYQGSQSCGFMFRNGLLDDATCSARVPFICEKLPISLRD